MKCPICNSIDLIIAERQGVEIDYCPQCRGIWLDRGEIDKIIERSYAPTSSRSQPEQNNFYTGHRSAPHETRHHDDHGNVHNDQHHKKSWLSELFD
ncbi:MAG: zf-TFIIB domain-containing protein [Deltaproteobacteria bacterium]|nr:zf-TFIIB domain-containing protein [Deltaproteobacteria bacterium]